MTMKVRSTEMVLNELYTKLLALKKMIVTLADLYYTTLTCLWCVSKYLSVWVWDYWTVRVSARLACSLEYLPHGIEVLSLTQARNQTHGEGLPDTVEVWKWRYVVIWYASFPIVIVGMWSDACVIAASGLKDNIHWLCCCGLRKKGEETQWQMWALHTLKPVI